ncbi:MAG: tryptophan synthase subunit alpha, partial [Methanocellales archaeon]|nr:tryptophan synthase subunit alpha [Methanocellales archaeon]
SIKSIRDVFEALRRKKEGALIAYICAGDPKPRKTVEIVNALVKGGVDIIELGLPFSDPIADGATIQAAMDRALTAGMNTDRFFQLVQSIKVDVPLVVMTYYNIILKRGVERFISECRSTGISGIIVPDLPVEESDELYRNCRKYNIDLIFLITPITTEKRIERILKRASGFIYVVSRLGVTGAREDITDQANGILKLVDKVNTSLPTAIGFGISKPEHVRGLIDAGADGVIVGSAFVDVIAKDESDMLEELGELAATLKGATRRPKTVFYESGKATFLRK